MHSDIRAIRGLLLASGAALILPVPALANPVGGTVSTGAAAIVQSAAGKTTIDQTSQGVVINWSSFNIGTGETIQFVQPNASAIAVNRIGGAGASQILGTLDANGRIVLINGNGLLFGKSARVNVGALIATSTDDTDSNALAGIYIVAGNPSASVVNGGRITAGQGGVVALVAPSVTNTGIVNAKLGTVMLGAANKFTVDLAGDGLVSFAAQGDVAGNAQATNAGWLSGATVSMTAHAAENLATGVVNMRGTIIAQAAHQVGGAIVLDAGNGALETTGTLDAAGIAGGGNIETSGNAAVISGTITAGTGGHWIVDPEDLTVDAAAAATIHSSLQHGTSVELQTTASGTSGSGVVSTGAGDIDIASTISWTSNATLTLDAYHGIDVLAPIDVRGNGTLSLNANAENTDGALSFDGGNIAFTDSTGGLTQGNLSINGNTYKLVNSVKALASDISGNPSGYFALADNYNARADGTYSSAPIATYFSGVFQGLGNNISGLTVTDHVSGDLVGLFAKTLTGAVIENINIINAKITGAASSYVGGLVGANHGILQDDSMSGKIETGEYVGGLSGNNNGGTILGSYSTATVVDPLSYTDFGYVGGLVGYNLDGGEIENSYATGQVKTSVVYAGDDIAMTEGGLVGQNEGVIENSYATGAVTGVSAGGLVGTNGNLGETIASISQSYATGKIGTGTLGILGGLVSINFAKIDSSYATGTVHASETDNGDLGGLVGDNYSGAQITNSELLPVLKTPRIGVFMEPEVDHGKTNVYERVQA